MKRMFRVVQGRYRVATLAALVVGVGVLAWPIAGLGEAVTPGQATERAAAPDPVGPPDRGSVLVHMAPGMDHGPVRAFAGAHGGIVKYEYEVVLPDVMNLRNIPAAARAALEKVPGVVRVEEDQYHENLIKLDEATPLIRALQSQLAGAGISADGAGVRVCVCDTGIDSDHLMYYDRIDTAAGYDFYNDDSDPEDDNGHGAHVAGIAVGGTGLTVDFGCEGPEPFQGVAPEATLIGVKILNQWGGGYDSDIIAGINYCADPAMPNGPADVMNLSIGVGNYAGTCDSHSWAVAANNAVDAGVVVVAASGNECNSNSMGSPACGSKVIAVGATWKDTYPNCEDPTSTFPWSCCVDSNPSVDDIVCFSNESDYLDVVAPGAVIWSASIDAGGSTITTKSGTSQSCPFVVGLAALLLDMDPSLTPAEVRQYIRDGAIDMGPAGFDRGYGYGRIDVIDTLSLLGQCPNGTCDPGENQCNCPDDCGTPPPTETSCTDEVDNDCDTYTDCDDSDCDSDPACLCGNDVCDPGEDCNTCPNDCFEGPGAVCGNDVCETADGEDCQTCPDDCNGKLTGAPSGRYCCGDGSGSYGVTCADPRCTGDGNTCTSDPAVPSCCGDGTCEGTENVDNCAVDCGCTTPAECDDSNDCTTDDCVDGVCENTPVADDTPCTDGICCDGTCDPAVCSSGADCNDSEACTTDTCLNPDTCAASCENTWPACGISDGCCGPACDSSNDPDCEECVPDGGYCTTNEECCSLSCHPAKDYCR